MIVVIAQYSDNTFAENHLQFRQLNELKDQLKVLIPHKAEFVTIYRVRIGEKILGFGALIKSR